MSDFSLEECECVDQKWTDSFATKRSWEKFDLEDPVEDLAYFFSCLSEMKLTKPRILDAGCGWGRYVYRFAGLEYTGIDHSEEMLKVARRDNVQSWQTFVQGTTSAMPFPDDHFDGIWSCCALAGFPMKYLADVLEEHRRVLKPGGIMTIVMADTLRDEEGMNFTVDGSPDLYQSRYTLPTFKEHLQSTGFELDDWVTRRHEGSFCTTLRNPT